MLQKEALQTQFRTIIDIFIDIYIDTFIDTSPKGE
jgi:hypothetical protein